MSTISELKLEELLKKQQEFETRLIEVEKELNDTKQDMKIVKEDISKQYLEIKSMFTNINTEIKVISERLAKTEVLNEVQEEKINNNMTFITGQNATMFKFFMYLTSLSLSGLFGFKIVEFIKGLL